MKNHASEHQLKRGLRESSFSPARLRQVRERLDHGFYELPEVQAEVARRLRLDLDLAPVA